MTSLPARSACSGCSQNSLNFAAASSRAALEGTRTLTTFTLFACIHSSKSVLPPSPLPNGYHLRLITPTSSTSSPGMTESTRSSSRVTQRLWGTEPCGCSFSCTLTSWISLQSSGAWGDSFPRRPLQSCEGHLGGMSSYS